MAEWSSSCRYGVPLTRSKIIWQMLYTRTASPAMNFFFSWSKISDDSVIFFFLEQLVDPADKYLHL